MCACHFCKRLDLILLSHCCVTYMLKSWLKSRIYWMEAKPPPLRWLPQVVWSPTENSFLHPGLNLTTEERISANILTFDHCDNSQFIGHCTFSQDISAHGAYKPCYPRSGHRRAKRKRTGCALRLYSLHVYPLTFSSVPSQTFAMKIPASMMALMCRSQPEFSSPHRKSLIEGDLSSHTARETCYKSEIKAMSHSTWSHFRMCWL